ncbi:MAG: hypothetical protein Q7R66_07660 [Undibacterium sp.]|uniref:hypothetical protein n=1 Tax=Undibacterium sp. TaxID=1914977 RepID=UPI00271C378A|nr:hypothetical protein [Undibacterium sp.]MDO8652049.1 hypothetical protein [Undibacterium sp.]
MSRITTVVALAMALLSTGCSLMAPQYTASVENAQALKDAGNFTAKVGEFSSKDDPANANPITVRGSSLASPYQNSYANYLAEAIKQELSLASKLSPDANLEISGVLLKNDIDASGINVGFASIEARFVVKKNGKVRYDQVKSVKHEFPSSFAGAVAIPRAVQEYAFAVQKLLVQLYTDKAFIETLK